MTWGNTLTVLVMVLGGSPEGDGVEKGRGQAYSIRVQIKNGEGYYVQQAGLMTEKELHRFQHVEKLTKGEHQARHHSYT